MTNQALRDTVASDDLAALWAGDEAAFARLAEHHRRELQVHCYRMLGSLEDSEDLVQETFLRAWRARASFEGRSSLRAWLYRIATNACLDAIARRPRAVAHAGQPALTEVPWLQPYPDRLLEAVPAIEHEPDEEVVAKETIELAFIAAIQLLPPRQRAVLIARDVLGWSAKQTAALLEVSVAAANSALQRARTTLRSSMPRHRLDWAPEPKPSRDELVLLRRYIDAVENGDPPALVALLREDALFTMPPAPTCWVGGEAIVSAWVKGGFGEASFGRFRCLPTRVNRQPALAVYLRRPEDDEHRAFMLDVLRIEDGKFVEITAFELDPPLREALGLPATLR
jgi:RNA polymerase sigma-70 factor (ECF subfamily)